MDEAGRRLTFRVLSHNNPPPPQYLKTQARSAAKRAAKKAKEAERKRLRGEQAAGEETAEDSGD